MFSHERHLLDHIKREGAKAVNAFCDKHDLHKPTPGEENKSPLFFVYADAFSAGLEIGQMRGEIVAYTEVAKETLVKSWPKKFCADRVNLLGAKLAKALGVGSASPSEGAGK